MQKRRRFKQTSSLDDRLAERARRLREEAEALPAGAGRDRLLRLARQAEIHLETRPMAFREGRLASA